LIDGVAALIDQRELSAAGSVDDVGPGEEQHRRADRGDDHEGPQDNTERAHRYMPDMSCEGSSALIGPTASWTSMVPAFAKVSVTGNVLPSTSCCFRSISMM
jgi:hypothetical protein